MMFIVTSATHAQDTLYKVDGSKHLAKIVELNETQVKYKLFSSLEGPTYVIGKESVLQIVYESGLVETFPQSLLANVAPIVKIDPRTVDFGRNFISVDAFDILANGTLTLSYEYIVKSGLVGYRLPVSYHIIDYEFRDNSYVFGIGADINIYPYGQGRIKFFYGPSFQFKTFETYSAADVNTAYALLFQAGFLFQPEKHINLSVTGALGYARLIRDDDVYEKKGDVAGNFGINLGYKF